MVVGVDQILAATKQAVATAPADMDKLFWVICGEKQVGKSTFASRFPSPFFIDAEHRLDSITTPEGVKPGQVKVYDWDTAVDWTKGFIGTTPAETGIETLVIDGGGVLFKYLAEKTLQGSTKNARSLNDEDLGFAKGWTIARDEYLKWWMSLRHLKDQGYGIVVTTHDRIVPFSNAGVDYDRKVPLIADDKDEKYGWGAIRPFSDVVIHVSKKRTKDGPVHMAQVRGNDLIEAGFPTPPHGEWMPDQLLFSYPYFRAAWDGTEPPT